MLKKIALIMLSIHISFANDLKEEVQDDSFITDTEYGKKLYENPRGISCKVCHGEYGKGALLSQYKHRGKLVEIHAPDISESDIETFKKKLRSNKGIMPKYYLTDSEIQAIFTYISNN